MPLLVAPSSRTIAAPRLRALAAALALVQALAVAPWSAAPAQAADAVAADVAPPATIRVCRSHGGVDTLPFTEYVKIVLPAEFPSNWHPEALRTGAVAIKSYAWYHILHPISDRCDIGDTTRYQLYAPERAHPTAATNQAVDDTWHLRIDDVSRGTVLYAQYCSGGCASHYRNAGEGRFIEQERARDLAQEGWSHVDLLNHFYRNIPPNLFDWTTAVAIRSTGEVISLSGDAAPFEVPVSGMAAGDARSSVELFASCTFDGSPEVRPLQAVVPVSSDGDVVARFDELDGLSECEDDEAALIVRAVVNGFVVRQVAVGAWRRWSADADLDVSRMASTDDPVAGSVAISKATFESFTTEANRSEAALSAVGDAAPTTQPQAEPARASFAVVARSDAFADALGATGLAGVDAPILLVPGGPDGRLPGSISSELDRVLEPGSSVVIVGGTGAVSQSIEEAIERQGFDVTRLAGSDRVATALAIADHLVARNGPTSRVVLARATPDAAGGWADAVTVGPWAASVGAPVLLTPRRVLDPQVEAWIEDPTHGVEEVIVVGGPGAVTAEVETRLDGVTVTRIAGQDRARTALAVADELWGTRGTEQADRFMVVDTFREGGWAFAVSGAVWAARNAAAAVAVANLVPPSSTGAWLDERAPRAPVMVVGGTGIVDAEVEAQLRGE